MGEKLDMNRQQSADLSGQLKLLNAMLSEPMYFGSCHAADKMF
jgi:hypothetical protein